jgi:hypothetical protein
MPRRPGRLPRRALLALALLSCPSASPQAPQAPFAWPAGARAALSLSFDDARPSQVEVGTALLDRHGVKVRQLLGVTPETFAYPCGQTFVGRGLDTRSYVPLVAGLFVAGRGWLGEAPNDPAFCDLAQVLGMEMDGRDFEQVLPILEGAREARAWLVLAGHEIGRAGPQTTRIAMLEKLLPYVRDPANGFWVAPVGAVARHIREQRGLGR